MSQCKSNPSKECTCDKEEIVKVLGSSANARMVGSSKYKEMKMEPWNEMEATETKENFLIYLRIAAKKHQLRLGRKDNTTLIEDIKKAHHILQKYIEVYYNDSDRRE